MKGYVLDNFKDKKLMVQAILTKCSSSPEGGLGGLKLLVAMVSFLPCTEVVKSIIIMTTLLTQAIAFHSHNR